MPHALLLSPDDQAVTAITGVLEEMSVTCERPLDGASAAQKLNSHSFDLVLVDCENLPAAKLIFDVCRRGKNGNNPVPIAIVDGRAGLPTAFRLGAELILTKPVAKDQARNTVRNAVSRVRKDVQTKESVPAQLAGATMPNPTMASAGVTEERALAAAAAPTSSQLTSFEEPAPSFAPTSVPNVTSEALTVVDHAAVDQAEDEIGVSSVDPKLAPQSASATPSLSESSPAPAVAKLEKTESEESQPPKTKQEISEPAKEVTTRPLTKAGAVSTSRRPASKQAKGPLVALLMLTVAGAGFYAAWTYQPGFRAMIQPQINRFLTLVGISTPPVASPSSAKPPAHIAPATPVVPASGSPTPPTPTKATRQDSATGSATASVAPSAVASVRIQPSLTPGAAVTPTLSAATKVSASVVASPKVDQSIAIEKDAAATPPYTALPGEDSAIVLSSKGAEKRLAQSVPPNYPAEARSKGAEGTVVLKEVVDENGKVAGVRLVEGNPTLATAAMNAVKQWHYRPYIRDGKAQPFQTLVIIDFQQP